MPRKPLVVIYIPSHNEEKTLAKIVRKINEYYIDIPQVYDLKIVVVNDGSKDNTAEIARELLRHGLIHRITTHVKNQGLGAATRSGLRSARDMGADVAVKIDADFQHDPKDIDAVIMPILQDTSDVVFGSRFQGGLQYKMPLYRKLGNATFSLITQFFTGLTVTDGQTGLIATNRRYLDKFRLVQDHNETQQMIIDAWRNQLRFIEVPVLFHKREHGTSFISFKYPFIVFPNIVRLFIHACPLKIFLPIGGFVLLLGLLSYILYVNNIWISIGKTTILILLLAGLQIILSGFIADIISKKR